MGFLEDINTILKSAGTLGKSLGDKTNKPRSIARGALDGTLQFPCLIANDIPVDMCATVTRTLERVYASFVQTYLSTNNIINLSNDTNVSQFMSKYHQNIKLEKTAEDIYKENCVENDSDYDLMMSRIYDGSTKVFVNENTKEMLVFNFSDKFNRHLYESNKELLEESLSSIDFKPFPNVGNSPFYISEAPEDSDMSYIDRKNIDISYDIMKKDYDAAKNLETNMKQDKFKFMNGDKLRVPTLTDTDVKKSNDLQPYALQMRLTAVNDNNEFVQFLDFIIGIKVVLHNIKSDDMIINIKNTLQNNGKFFNFIRWTTGEISLFKDLLFKTNDVKLDVANRSSGSSRWWMTLKRLKSEANLQSAFFSKRRIVPNSTIVISSYDTDAVRKSCGYDLHNPKFAKKLMSSLFLMNFVIIDEGTRTVEVLYDGESSFQTYALETFEREVSMNSNKIGKELTRMISR